MILSGTFRDMAVWGIDLGVRSYYAAGLHTNHRLELVKHDIVIRGKVRDQAPTERALELASLSQSLSIVLMPGDEVFIEEPPLAGGKNPRTFLKLAQISAVVGVSASLANCQVRYIPVDTWKKEGCVGRGGAGKELVSDRLRQAYPGYHEQCGGDQNFVDATHLALYGRTMLEQLAHPVHRAIGPGGADPSHERLVAS